MKAELLPIIGGALAILIIGVAFALTLRLRKLEQLIMRFGDNEERSRQPKQRPRVEEPPLPNKELRAVLDSLRSRIDRIPGDTARQVAAALEKQPPEPPSAPPPRTMSSSPEPEDALAQLLAIANRIVQQSSTTLDAFRASAGALATHVVAWPGTADGVPAAFIVEHRGAHYAVPNVVKPARLPKEWFNRSEFGVNDEIQRVLSLPRLRRHAEGYDVQEAGVFGR